MKILPATDENILIAVDALQNGGIVVFPTDTVYGIGCNLQQSDAVEKIYRIKGRPAAMPLIAMFSKICQYQQLTDDIHPDAERYMQEWWPGALTIILNAKTNLPVRVLAGGNTIGMRIPAHPAALALLNKFDFPLATTSANLSGKPSPCSADEAIQSLGINAEVDVVLDAGLTPGGTPSTLLDCTKNPPEILRQGEITAQMLRL